MTHYILFHMIRFLFYIIFIIKIYRRVNLYISDSLNCASDTVKYAEFLQVLPTQITATNHRHGIQNVRRRKTNVFWATRPCHSHRGITPSLSEVQ